MVPEAGASRPTSRRNSMSWPLPPSAPSRWPGEPSLCHRPNNAPFGVMSALPLGRTPPRAASRLSAKYRHRGVGNPCIRQQDLSRESICHYLGMLKRRQINTARRSRPTRLRCRGRAWTADRQRRVGGRWLGAALVNETAFLRRALAMALADRASAIASDGWVFFDRGLIDAAAGLQHLTGEPLLEKFGQFHRYHRRVFLAPPWPEIYVQDAERWHDFDSAITIFTPSQSLPISGLRGLDLAKGQRGATR